MSQAKLSEAVTLGGDGLLVVDPALRIFARILSAGINASPGVAERYSVLEQGALGAIAQAEVVSPAAGGYATYDRDAAHVPVYDTHDVDEVALEALKLKTTALNRELARMVLEAGAIAAFQAGQAPITHEQPAVGSEDLAQTQPLTTLAA